MRSETLAAGGHVASASLLHAILTEDEDEEVKVAALEALVLLEGASAETLLVSILEDEDGDEDVKVAAVHALARLHLSLQQEMAGHKNPQQPALGADARARIDRLTAQLKGALQQTNDGVCIAAIEVCEPWYDREVRERLIEILLTTPGPHESDLIWHKREAAAKMVGICREQAAFDALVLALGGGMQHAREEATLALGALKCTDAIDTLVGQMRLPARLDPVLDTLGCGSAQ